MGIRCIYMGTYEMTNQHTNLNTPDRLTVLLFRQTQQRYHLMRPHMQNTKGRGTHYGRHMRRKLKACAPRGNVLMRLMET